MREKSSKAFEWFSADTWATTKRMSEDKARWDATFEEWEAKAKKVQDELLRGHRDFCKVFVFPAALKRWCKENQAPINKRSLAKYVRQVAKEVDMDESGEE